MSFVHLHVHSEYSLLDGFSNIKRLVKRAKELGMPAIALTDHGTMFGVVDFYNAAKKEGIKPIIGIEAYMAARGMGDKDAQLDKKSSHLLLLAENQTGYQNLLKLASAAQLEGFYYYPRVDHEILEQYSEGLICTSGCISAEIPRMVREGKTEAARSQLDWYYEVFGPDRFFLELQNHNIEELERVNKQLLELGRRYEARFVATNDVHYIKAEDARLQDILLAVQTGCLLSDPERMRMTDESYFLRSPEEMSGIFSEVPSAISNTVWIAERCEVDLSFKGYKLPEFDVPEGHTPGTYLRELCEAGLSKRYKDRANHPGVRERLDHELKVIHDMGFDTYFLIVWDLCRYARSKGIWYNARGSAAGSIVAYTLDITLVDPLEHGLIFERFLNPGRVSMPDIDLDFRDDCRAEMMSYTANRYGDDKVAQIITFGTMGARAAIRDVGRVMDVPLNEVDKVAKLIPNIPGKPVTIAGALKEVPEFKSLYTDAPYLRDLIDTAQKMEGVVRSVGTHAAGVIITDKPIIEYIPLHRPTGSSISESPIKTVTQFEMNVVDSLGLLKVDFLGLSTLTIMARACDLIYERHGVRFHLGNIPTDDPETYELLGRGETAGVFQVEGSGMRRWLMQMKPQQLANVIAMVALFRPGPMDFIPGYINRMHGDEAVEYRHPLLEEIFEETYGYPVYQEQLMFAAMKLAGYTPSEADDLRKAIAKKIKTKLQKHRQKFIDGAVNNSVPADTAAEVFDDWEEFARYGFNKSHAVDYGVIAVQTAYLKCHYPVEYMTALLSVSKNDTGKVAFYAADCRRMGIEIKPPDINTSEWDFSIEENKGEPPGIRFGMGAVKNVGQAPVETILEGRKDGAFFDLNDFARRVDLRHVGKRTLECLTKVGALDVFGSRLAILESIDRIISVSASHFRAAESGQMSLFGAHTGVEEDIDLPPSRIAASRREVLSWERELIGLYVSDHPLSPVMEDLQDVVTHLSGQLAEVSPTEHVRVAGLITMVRHHQTRAGKAMGFVTIEDLQGTIDLVVFPRTWEQYKHLLEPDRIVLVDGRIDPQGGEAKLLVDKITAKFSQRTPLENLDPSGGIQPNTLPNSADPSGIFSDRSRPVFEDEDRVVDDTRGIPEMQMSGIQPEVAENLELDDVDMPPEPEEPPDWDYPAFGGVTRDRALDRGQGGSTDQAMDLEKGLETNSATDIEKPQVGSSMELLVPFESEPIMKNYTQEPTPVAGDVVVQPTQVEGEETYVDAVGAVDEGDPPPALSAANELSELPPYLVPPASTIRDEGEVRMLTVVLRQTGDKTRDVLRLRRIHGIVASYPGNDRFAVHIFERDHGYLLEFPNFTIGVSEELVIRLKGLCGKENVRVEGIKFH